MILCRTASGRCANNSAEVSCVLFVESAWVAWGSRRLSFGLQETCDLNAIVYQGGDMGDSPRVAGAVALRGRQGTKLPRNATALRAPSRWKIKPELPEGGGLLKFVGFLSRSEEPPTCFSRVWITYFLVNFWIEVRSWVRTFISIGLRRLVPGSDSYPASQLPVRMDGEVSFSLVFRKSVWLQEFSHTLQSLIIGLITEPKSKYVI